MNKYGLTTIPASVVGLIRFVDFATELSKGGDFHAKRGFSATKQPLPLAFLWSFYSDVAYLICRHHQMGSSMVSVPLHSILDSSEKESHYTLECNDCPLSCGLGYIMQAFS